MNSLELEWKKLRKRRMELERKIAELEKMVEELKNQRRKE